MFELLKFHNMVFNKHNKNPNPNMLIKIDK